MNAKDRKESKYLIESARKFVVPNKQAGKCVPDNLLCYLRFWVQGKLYTGVQDFH